MRTLSDKPLNLDPIKNGSHIETINFYSEAMQDLYKKVVSIANTEQTIILVGEQGTGKRYLATLIHSLSAFSNDSFRDIFCNTLEETIQEIVEKKETDESSPGHEQLDDDLGLDVISGGTLFFNSFSELSNFNKKILLHILHAAQRMARQMPTDSKSRFIISIDENSYQEFKNKSFWTRLLDLVNPFIINVPPLREHCEDITLLIDRFLLDYAVKHECQVHAIAPRAVYKCISYHWPGNIRQLKNTIEHAATVVPAGSVITANQLPFSLDWRSPYQHSEYDMTNNESFARAEQLLLKEIATNPNISARENGDVDQDFSIPIKDKTIFLS